MVKLRYRSGQFMVISAVVIGIIIMTLAGTISKITSQQFEPDSAKYEINMIKDETEKLDLKTSSDRERLRRTLNLLNTYNAEMEYWARRECVNITLKRTDRRFKLECIEGGVSKLDPRKNIIENFRNMSHYNGNLGDYSTTNSPAYNGGQSLTTGSTSSSYISTGQQNNLPERGDLFRAMFRTDDAKGYGRMYFASPDGSKDNAYFIQISHRDGNIKLYKNVNGNQAELGGDTFNRYQMAYSWNFVEVNFGRTDNNIIEVYYYQEGDRDNPQAAFSVDDTEFDEGHIGWSLYDNSGGSTDLYWDYMHFPD